MFPVYSLKGSPYEIGFQHGQQASERVEQSVNNYKMMFMVLGGSWEEICAETEKFMPILNRLYPDLVEEMKGVADGSGQEFSAILAINARSELLVNKTRLIGEGCTSFAVHPEKTGGPTLMGQNWDFPILQKDSVIILRIEQPGKPKILMVTEAGIVGKIGFNETGVGICMNAIITDAIQSGTPLHIVMRGVLDSWNLSSAMQRVAKSKTASSINFIIAQHSVTAVNMEVTPRDFEPTFPRDGFIAHTNHLLCDRLLSGVTDFGREMGTDSFLRLDRANRLFSEATHINIAKLKEIQRDHYSYPTGICRHLDPADPMMIASVFGVVMDLQEKVMYIAPGQPCENEYTSVKLGA
jgi:isopenicillin-N N-acyltransferase-like protein